MESMRARVEAHPEYRVLARTAETLKGRAGVLPAFGIVLGSGFKSLLNEVDESFRIGMDELEGLKCPSVAGHSSDLVFGRIAGVEVMAFGGRVHAYEGFGAMDVVGSVFLMAAMGVRSVLLTNAAGLIKATWNPGELMVIEDHINLSGLNPLIGLNHAHVSDRFLDLSMAWDGEYQSLMADSLEKSGLPVRRGTYASVLGPTYETPAEVRAFQTMGADAVGMSTVLECIAARYLGMRVVGLSCLTNWAAGVSARPVSHQDVLEISKANERLTAQCLRHFFRLAGAGGG